MTDSMISGGNFGGEKKESFVEAVSKTETGILEEAKAKEMDEAEVRKAEAKKMIEQAITGGAPLKNIPLAPKEEISQSNVEVLIKEASSKVPVPQEALLNTDSQILSILKDNGCDSQQQVQALARLKELLGF